MTPATKDLTAERAPRQLPRWLPRLRRILDILATGGGIWVTETPRTNR